MERKSVASWTPLNAHAGFRARGSLIFDSQRADQCCWQNEGLLCSDFRSKTISRAHTKFSSGCLWRQPKLHTYQDYYHAHLQVTFSPQQGPCSTPKKTMLTTSGLNGFCHAIPYFHVTTPSMVPLNPVNTRSTQSGTLETKEPQVNQSAVVAMGPGADKEHFSM